MIPKISVNPEATRKSSSPYCSPFRHWTRKMPISMAWPRRSCVQRLVLRLQLVGTLDEVGVDDDAVGRTHEPALRLVLGAYAFGAAQRVDDVDRIADADRFVRAHRLAGVAGGAVVVDEQCHETSPRAS